MKNFKPLQYNFFDRWHTDIRQIWQTPKMRDACEELLIRWSEMSEHWLENADEEQGHAEFALALHEGEAKHRDLEWLRKTFEDCSLSLLSRAIAETLYPDKKWQVIEFENDVIVSDAERSLVFDIKYFDKLTGAESLARVHDYQPNDANFELQPI